MPLSTDTTGAVQNGARQSWVRSVYQRLWSGMVQNAAWMLSGNTLQLAGRFAYFVMVARMLGPTGYGTFVACTALVSTMSPFACMGTGDVMIKYVARDRSMLAAYFGNALLVTVAVGSLLTMLALLLRSTVLPATATTSMLAAICLADLLGTQVTGICLQVFLALEQASRYARFVALSTGLRILAAVFMAVSTTAATPQHWAYLYFASGMVSTVSGLVAVSCCCALPRFRLNLLVPSVREGFHFATSLASQFIYDDIDKTMLARLSTAEAAAIYAVACRFVEAAMLPIRSVASATYPEFFRQGRNGVTATFRFARRILRHSAVYGLAVTVALFLSAGVVPWILGAKYAQSAPALRWLCLLPLIKSVHAFLTDTLTGANYQWQRSSAQIGVAAFNILINLWIIRAYAWRGAACSSLMSDSLLLVLLYLIIRWHLRRERSTSVTISSQPIFATGEK